MVKSQYEQQLDDFVRKTETNNDGKPWGPDLRQEYEAAKKAGNRAEMDRIRAAIMSLGD